MEVTDPVGPKYHTSHSAGVWDLECCMCWRVMNCQGGVKDWRPSFRPESFPLRHAGVWVAGG